MDRLLAVLGGVADVAYVGAEDIGKLFAQGLDHRARVIDAQRRLRHVGDLLRVSDLDTGDMIDCRYEMHAAVHPAARALDLGVPLVADEDDLSSLALVLLRFLVNLGDEGTGGVDHRQLAFRRVVGDLLRDAMGAEDGDGAVGYLVDLVDEARAFRSQVIDDLLVVDDLVADVDRRAVDLERPLDDGDGALDAGAEPSGLSEDNFHRALYPLPFVGADPLGAKRLPGVHRQSIGQPIEFSSKIGRTVTVNQDLFGSASRICRILFCPSGTVNWESLCEGVVESARAVARRACRGTRPRPLLSHAAARRPLRA